MDDRMSQLIQSMIEIVSWKLDFRPANRILGKKELAVIATNPPSSIRTTAKVQRTKGIDIERDGLIIQTLWGKEEGTSPIDDHRSSCAVDRNTSQMPRWGRTSIP
jgi:hypothetical protein